MNVVVRFPKKYSNWKGIISCCEAFLKSAGYTAFVTPAEVEDFETDPELPADLYNEMVEKLAEV